MRIVTITPGYPPDMGGVEAVAAYTSDGLARAGHDVEVWTQGRGLASTVTRRTPDGVVVRRFPAGGTARFPVSPALARFARRHGGAADLVHAHNFHAVAAASALLIPSSTPLVLSAHFHGGGHTFAARVMHVPYRPVGRRLVSRAAVVVAVSETEAKRLRIAFPAQGARVTVVHNGCDAASIAAAAPWPGDRPTALVLGRLEPYKRVDRIIGAFAHLVDRASIPADSRLVIVGDGPDRRRLEDLAAAAPRRSVEFRGRLDDDQVRRWLRTANVVVSMSEHEAFGMIALEAAAGGASAVLSDIDAHREVAGLTPGGRTRLVPPPAGGDDPLATALGSALRERGRTPRDVRSWDDVVGDYEVVYRGIVGHIPDR